MSLAQVRKSRGVTLDELSLVVGRSKGTLSDVENGAATPSLELALRIQVWSEGAVPAAELRPDLKDLIDAALKTSPAGEGVAA
jgi:transcriptional regulator with XRE-family HTH domain